MNAEGTTIENIYNYFAMEGPTVEFDCEESPFEGGTLTFSGLLNLKLYKKNGTTTGVTVGGEINVSLANVARAGNLENIPYSLGLNGTCRMYMNGEFTVKIKDWAVWSMSAELKYTIRESNITAEGTFGTSSVKGSVSTTDVGITMSNSDVFCHPENLNITCSGEIQTRINDKFTANYAIAE